MKNIRAAFRYALFVISTLGLYAFWFVCDFFIPNKILWRQIIFHKWAQSFVAVSRMRIEVIGNVPPPPFFLVCNHLSYTDVAALRAVLEGVFVAKGEMESWFLAGRIVRDMGTVFINRQNRRDIPRAGREIIKRLEGGEGVIVFPEGTSTKGEEILPFNSSFLEFAAQTDLPVSYASITYKTPANEPTASESICWWDEKTFGEHLWYLFQLKEYTAVINFGDEPIHNANRKVLARELREKVLEKFIPVI
ncbi:MAG: 1-acyl-sn-glycerol-3-phosphate acyltransferase [Acidobacteriota bacterium]|nr:1-acyl-sn-glycerol-3-phosphate acyltransferase [Acidobacteriota bacterium]